MGFPSDFSLVVEKNAAKPRFKTEIMRLETGQSHLIPHNPTRYPTPPSHDIEISIFQQLDLLVVKVIHHNQIPNITCNMRYCN